jgi:cell division protein FtsB
MTPLDLKVTVLVQQLKFLETQVDGLKQRINFLERENNRRKSDVNQVASLINKKG